MRTDRVSPPRPLAHAARGEEATVHDSAAAVTLVAFKPCLSPWSSDALHKMIPSGADRAAYINLKARCM